MANPLGRPMKYRNIIEILEDHTVYTPGLIVRQAIEKEVMVINDPEEKKKLVTKVRHALARFKSNHKFPTEPDGHVFLPGQSAQLGWYGYRWKNALPPKRKVKP